MWVVVVVLNQMLSLVVLMTMSVALSGANFDRGFNANIKWSNKLEDSYHAAVAEAKPLAVLVHKTWCGACKRLKSVFSNAEIEELSKDFVMVNLEDDEEPSDDLYKPDGGYIPRLLFIDPSTRELLPVYNVNGNPSYKYYYSSEDQIIAAMKAASNKKE